MHPQPTLIAALTRDRVAELRRGAPSRHRPTIARSARRRTGVLLVNVGLKLALGR
jgi:hypothetical protein